jgi:hypothetical protein
MRWVPEAEKTRNEKMNIRTHEAARVRAQYASLTRHYRQIGPAAILAALMFRKPAQTTRSR